MDFLACQTQLRLNGELIRELVASISQEQAIRRPSRMTGRFWKWLTICTTKSAKISGSGSITFCTDPVNRGRPFILEPG